MCWLSYGIVNRNMNGYIRITFSDFALVREYISKQQGIEISRIKLSRTIMVIPKEVAFISILPQWGASIEDSCGRVWTEYITEMEQVVCNSDILRFIGCQI